MMKAHRAMAAVWLLAAVPLLAACEEKLSAEQAGSEIGRAVDEVGEQFGWIANEIAAVVGSALKTVGIALENDAESKREPREPSHGGGG